MHELPTVDVKIKVEGPGCGNTRVYIDGIEVTDLLMSDPFTVLFENINGIEYPTLVVGLPIGDLEIDTRAFLNAVGMRTKVEVA